jgi:hypothetical protein
MQQVSAGLRDVLGITPWRKAPPRATWAESEALVEERMKQVRAQVLQDVVQMGESEDWRERAQEERPRCARCGKPLSARGKQTRLPAHHWRASGQANAHLWSLSAVGGRLFSRLYEE